MHLDKLIKLNEELDNSRAIEKAFSKSTPSNSAYWKGISTGLKIALEIITGIIEIKEQQDDK